MTAREETMEEEVRDLLHRVLNDIVTLDITLYFNNHPDAVDSQEGICSRVAHETASVTKALDTLTDAGIIDCATLGDGRYDVYSLTRDKQTRTLISRLSSCYHNDPVSRAEIVRHIVAASLQSHRHPAEVSSGSTDAV
jgi:hypothetical protein